MSETNLLVEEKNTTQKTEWDWPDPHKDVDVLRRQLRETAHALGDAVRALDAMADHMRSISFFDRPHGRAVKRHMDSAKARMGKLGISVDVFDADAERGA